MPSQAKPLDTLGKTSHSLRVESAYSRENHVASQRHYRPGRSETASFFAARLICFVSILFVTWNIGGTAPNTLLVLTPLVALGHLFVLLTKRSLTFRYQSLPLGCLALLSALIVWTSVQTLPLPNQWIARIAPGSDAVYAEFLTPSVNEANVAAQSLDPSVPVQTADKLPISIIPSATYKSIGLFVLASALFALAAMVFDTRGSRTSLLWLVAINATVLASWGLMQRISGSLELLPGYTLPQVRSPFGPFIYKNAGAAALIPGIAAAFALLWTRVLPRDMRRGSSTGPSRSSDSNHLAGSQDAAALRQEPRTAGDGGYAPAGIWTSTPTILVLVVLVLLVSGLVVAFSRGAWGATVVCLAVLTLLSTHRPFFRRIALPFSIVCFVAAAVIGLSGLSDLVKQRATRLSLDSISTDDRWEHWKNGVRTAMKHFPSGSGAGTYGYAQLVEQPNDQNAWFREAHNHYIEVFAESGLIGFAILLIAFLVLLHGCIKVFRLAASREWSSWGLIGIILLVAAAVQSTVDFVIEIPGVLLVVATLLGVAARVSSQYADEVKRFRSYAKSASVNPSFLRRGLSLTAPWCAMTLIAFAFTGNFLLSEQRSEACLQSTEISEIDFEPTDLDISTAVAQLTDAIEAQPSMAALYQRRSLWHQLAYRRELIRRGSEKGYVIPWQATTPESVLYVSKKLDEASRRTLLDDLNETPSMREQLALALSDISSSLIRNPLVPQVHIAGALLSTSGRYDRTPWLDRAIRLSRSNQKLQFTTGLIAFYAGDVPTAVKQWRSTLATTMQDFDTIVSLAEQVMTPEQITLDLIPLDRSELQVAWLRRRAAFKDDPKFLSMLAQQSSEQIMADVTLPIGRKHVLIAMCFEANAQWREANTHWAMAVKEDGANADTRYAYTQSLIKIGEYEEAIKQASLGSSLEPREVRFPEAAELANKKRKDRSRK
jgi:O-antigen ligase/tetratricopeptide (TPR) repeat protein